MCVRSEAPTSDRGSTIAHKEGISWILPQNSEGSKRVLCLLSANYREMLRYNSVRNRGEALATLTS